MQINQRLQIMQRASDSLQFGSDSQSLILEGLTEGDHRLIEVLRRGTGSKSLGAVAAACDLQPARARYLVNLLKPVLTETVHSEPGLEGLRADRLAPDILQWSIAYEQDAAPLMERRARSVVRIIGLGRAGSAVAQALAGSGIGTLLLEDDALVGPSDVGAAAFRLGDVGLTRSSAVRRQIRHIDPTIQTHLLHRRIRPGTPDYFPVDLVVSTGQDRLDPLLLAELMHHRQAHLPVILCERDLEVGPLVIPGESACVECVERHQADGAPQFSALLSHAAEPATPVSPGRPAHSASRSGSSDSSTAVNDGSPSSSSASHPVSAEESALALAGASTAVLQSLLFIDAVHQPASWSTVLQLRAADGRYFQRSYPPHQQCPCQVEARNRSAGQPVLS